MLGLSDDVDLDGSKDVLVIAFSGKGVSSPRAHCTLYLTVYLTSR